MLFISVLPTNQRPSQGAAAIFEGRVRGICHRKSAAQYQTLQGREIIKAGQLSKETGTVTRRQELLWRVPFAKAKFKFHSKLLFCLLCQKEQRGTQDTNN